MTEDENLSEQDEKQKTVENKRTFEKNHNEQLRETFKPKKNWKR